jgi:hypothetical protein
LLGLARVHFLSELRRFGVSPIQLETGEFEQDIAHAKSMLDD